MSGGWVFLAFAGMAVLWILFVGASGYLWDRKQEREKQERER